MYQVGEWVPRVQSWPAGEYRQGYVVQRFNAKGRCSRLTRGCHGRGCSMTGGSPRSVLVNKPLGVERGLRPRGKERQCVIEQSVSAKTSFTVKGVCECFTRRCYRRVHRESKKVQHDHCKYEEIVGGKVVEVGLKEAGGSSEVQDGNSMYSRALNWIYGGRKSVSNRYNDIRYV